MHAFGATGACEAVSLQLPRRPHWRFRFCSASAIASPALPSPGPEQRRAFSAQPLGVLEARTPTGLVTCAPRPALYSVQEREESWQPQLNFAEDDRDLEKQLQHVGDRHYDIICHEQFIREPVTTVCSELFG
ncbi:hypothetical protein MRX96_022715 [Rhipicephalus microplus]